MNSSFPSDSDEFADLLKSTLEHVINEGYNDNDSDSDDTDDIIGQVGKYREQLRAELGDYNDSDSDSGSDYCVSDI